MTHIISQKNALFYHPKLHPVVQVRKVEELDRCEALVIPGGESTTMKIVAGTDEWRGTEKKTRVNDG